MAKRQKSIGRMLVQSKKPQQPEIIPPAPVGKGIVAGDGLENIIAGLGTSRDKRSHTHYTAPRMLTRFDLENMFRTSHTAKRIVTAAPDVATREWREFKLEDDDDNPMIDALTDADKALCLADKFKEAWYWARLYGAGMMILGLADARTAIDMMKPLDVTKVKKGDLRYIHVVDRWRCAPSGKFTVDLTDPNFGMPESYLFADTALEIHHTRVVRFNGQKLPYFAWLSNGMWDDSELQHCLESVLNYDTAMASVGSMLFEANIDVVSSEGLTDLLSTASGEAKLLKRFQLGQMMKSFNRTLLLDAKEKYEKKNNTFANLDNILREYKHDVCGASRHPMSILFGEQVGGLGSGGDDDLRNFYDFVVEERGSKIQKQLDYVDQIFVRSVLGTFPDGYKSEWKSLWQVDDADQSDIDLKNAQRDQIYLGASVVTEGLVASELKRRGTYASMSTEDVQLAEELSEKMDEHDDIMREQQQNPPEDEPSVGGQQK
jgi:phage-related protein (TIGR01555 family)